MGWQPALVARRAGCIPSVVKENIVQTIDVEIRKFLKKIEMFGILINFVNNTVA